MSSSSMELLDSLSPREVLESKTTQTLSKKNQQIRIKRNKSSKNETPNVSVGIEIIPVSKRYSRSSSKSNFSRTSSKSNYSVTSSKSYITCPSSNSSVSNATSHNFSRFSSISTTPAYSLASNPLQRYSTETDIQISTRKEPIKGINRPYRLNKNVVTRVFDARVNKKKTEIFQKRARNSN